MDEELKLKSWIAKRLGVRDGIEVLWDQLEEDHNLGEYRQGYIDRDGLLSKARKKVKRAHQLSYAFGGIGRATQPENGKEPEDGKDSPPEEYFEVELNDYEEKRARAYEETLAREAGLTQEIAEFRRRLLGDQLLTLEQAHELLDSPAARFLQLSLFELWGIPLVGHRAELLAYETSPDSQEIDHRATIRIEPPSITKTVRYANDDATEIGGKRIDWHWYLHRDADGRVGFRPENHVLRYNDKDGLKEEMWVWPASVLDRLRAFSARWARILGWAEEDMTLWLLCGEPPRIEPITAKVRYKIGSPLTLDLTVHPWVPAETVLDNYRRMQRQLLGQENHRLKLRSLNVLRFVESCIRQEGRCPPWRKLLEQWNKQHAPDESFGDVRNFQRVYKRTLDRVAHGSFYLPRPKPFSPAAQRKMDEKVGQAKAAEERILESLRRPGAKFVKVADEEIWG